MPFEQGQTKYFRRLKPRIKAHQEVWVYWNCDGRDEFFQISDIGLGGIFLETSKVASVGRKTKLNFLAREGYVPKRQYGMQLSAED